MYEASFLYGRGGAAMQAMSAIDIACTDLLARYLGVSVAHLLGGRYRDEVPAYASAVLPRDAAEARSLAAAVSERGFTALKVGWGSFREDTQTIVSLLDEIRGALHPSVRLIFDIGYERWRTAKQIIELIRVLQQYDPIWIEEPCHPDN